MNSQVPIPTGLIDVVEARRPDILRRWEARVRALLSPVALSPLDRMGSLALLVDKLLVALRRGTDAESLRAAGAIAREHGRQRYQAGAEAAAVVREYGLLRDVILEVLEEEQWGGDPAGLRTVCRVIDALMAEAVARYTDEHEQALRATEARLLHIIDHAPAAIYAKDDRGRYLFVNAPFERAAGHRRQEVVGRTDADIFPPEVAATFQANDLRVLQAREPLSFDEQVEQPDGMHVYHSLKFPMPGAQGAAGAVCGISTDITESRRLQHERDQMREQLQAVLTHLPIVLWSMDTRGTLTLFEGDGVTLEGNAPFKMQGRSIFEVFADRPDVVSVTLRALAGEAFTTELYLFGIWFEVRFFPVRGPDGRVVSVSGLSVDITDRRRAELELRQSEMRYRLATRATSDVIWDLDLEGGGIDWSELAARVFRMPDWGTFRADLDWWSGRLHPEDRDRVNQHFHGLLEEGGEHWTDEYRFLRGDNTWAVIQDRGQVLRDAAGRAVRMVGAMQDITDRREAEAQAKRRAEFEQLLIGIVGHDLRNPISAISMAATTLERRDNLDERERRSVSRILSSAERAARLLRDVLDFTQARLGGGIRTQPRPLDLHELVRQVTDEVLLAHPQRRLEVVCTGDARGVWDPDRLAQVITNLVNNALAYGDAHCSVRVRTRGEADAVVLSVHNDGPAIPPDLLPHLFEPLKRAEHAQGGLKGHGLGLGLFIVKHVVDAHGGTLRVRSTEEDGTTFQVRLPRACSHQSPSPPASTPSQP